MVKQVDKAIWKENTNLATDNYSHVYFTLPLGLVLISVRVIVLG